MLSMCMWKPNKHSMGGSKHSWQTKKMHQIHGNGGLQLRRLSSERALVCHLWRTEEVGWSGPHCFRCSLTPNSVEIVFNNHTLVTLVQYYVLLLSGSALFVVCFWILILMVSMILTDCSHSLTSRWLKNHHLSWLQLLGT